MDGRPGCLPHQEQAGEEASLRPCSGFDLRAAPRAPPGPSRAARSAAPPTPRARASTGRAGGEGGNREAILRVRRSPRAALCPADAAPAKFESEPVRPPPGSGGRWTPRAGGLAAPEPRGREAAAAGLRPRDGAPSQAPSTPQGRAPAGARVATEARGAGVRRPAWAGGFHPGGGGGVTTASSSPSPRLASVAQQLFSPSTTTTMATRCPWSLESGGFVGCEAPRGPRGWRGGRCL